MEGLMQEVPLTLVQAFERCERLFGTNEVVTATEHGRHRLTYASWAERTRRLGGALDGLGLSADARVATFGWNTWRHLELYFAAPCSGRVLHTLNVRLFADQLVYIANHAEDEVVFCDGSLLPTLWPLVDRMKTVRRVVVMGPVPLPDDARVVDYEDLLASSQPVEWRVDDERQAAAMCYTSGTTGNPKGVVYSHRSSLLYALGALAADGAALSEADRVLPAAPMFHANAWGLPNASVLCGATLILPGPDLSPAALARLIRDERVTVASGVPTVWMGLLPLLETGEADVSSLRTILCGGSAVPQPLLEAYHRRGVWITQVWGMTETSLASFSRVKRSVGPPSEAAEIKARLSQGLPLPLVDTRVVEPGTTTPLPWNGSSVGELQVRGPWAARAYYQLEGSESPLTPDGWLRTGDVATIDSDGYIRLVDRTKDLVRSGGEWISSVELENAIMRHPDVVEAAVIAVPHPKWGERPLACVVVREGASLDMEALRKFLEGKVAKWWVPDDMVTIDAVPKTSVGKFDKKDLRERYRDRLMS